MYHTHTHIVPKNTHALSSATLNPRRKIKQMEKSWRLRMEMPTPKLPNCPPRRSTEDAATAEDHRKTISSSDDPLNPEAFTDVFGGPPRSILSRRFSRYSSSSAGFFYDDIFQQPHTAAPGAVRAGRNLPQFKIPAGRRWGYQNNGFCGNVFGWDDERVVRSSRSRSKTSSSSALSSEELSPLRPAVSDDGYDDVSFFASKLRPINVRPRWNSRRTEHEDHQKQPYIDINYHPIPNSPAEDLHLNSPSSAVSSVSHSDGNIKNYDISDDISIGDDDESTSSYVIEIGSDNRCESNGVDEAIAWAKERFRRPCLDDQKEIELENELLEGEKDGFESMYEQRDERAPEEETGRKEREIQILDEKIKLWSTGKEADIRLLLSSLHHVLWPNSGWLATPLMNMIENSEVKKTYQKAQLCLHPDKLQQRGATIMQKYIAKKAFSTLQDAWAAFISQNGFPY